MYDKSTRVLYLLQQLLEGRTVNKSEIQALFEIDSRTFERDIATLRTYFGQRMNQSVTNDIEYDHQQKCYYLTQVDHSKLSKEEVLSLCKLLLGSRAFAQEDLDELIKHLLNHLHESEKKQIQSFIGNERLHFTPLKHGERLIPRLWDFSTAIEVNRQVQMEYKKANHSISTYTICPVGLVFSDYYFYAVSYVVGKSIPYPISFRLDRILSYKILTETFNIPYSQRFESGDFRNKINMMYQGELIKFTFRFTGHSVEAVLDKFPVSRVIEDGDGYCIIEAVSHEQGLLMWLLSQGEWVQVLTPHHLVEKMKEKFMKIINLY